MLTPPMPSTGPTGCDSLSNDITVLRNAGGMTATFMNQGASWLSAVLPLTSAPREVLLGCASMADYLRQGAYLGASVGRYANRIAHARLQYQDKIISLTPNQGKHQLHGGPHGFNAYVWQKTHHTEQQVIYSLFSPEGDQGFPGNLSVQVIYTLSDDHRLTIEYQAQTDQPCPVNLTNHAYFNLDGYPSDVRQHQLQLMADYYLPVDAEGIPSAPLCSVTEQNIDNDVSHNETNGMDFRQPKPLLRDFLRDEAQRYVGGYDHGYLLRTSCQHCAAPAAHLWSADKRVKMSVWTSEPALQVYSGNFLSGTPAREGGVYANYAGIALESGYLADTPHHPEWPQPNCWLQPGETYHAVTIYGFEF